MWQFLVIIVIVGLVAYKYRSQLTTITRRVVSSTSTPPAPGTSTPSAPGTPAARPLWKRLAWPVGIILVILALANASFRDALWTTGAPAVHSWTTGAKTFDVTITSTDEFVIGKVDAGYWDIDMSNVAYYCKDPAGNGFYSGNTTGTSKFCAPGDCPAPGLKHSALLVTNGLDRSGYVKSGQMIATKQGDELKGVLNHVRGCPLDPPISVRITLSKH